MQHTQLSTKNFPACPLSNEGVQITSEATLENPNGTEWLPSSARYNLVNPK